MKYESTILKRLIDTYGVVGNPRYISEIINEFIVRGKESFPNLFTYQADWLAHIDEFGLNPSYTVSYTGQSIYAPNTLERPVKSAILKGQTSTGKNLYMGQDTSNTDHEWASYPITLEPNTYVMSNDGTLRVSTVINYETGNTIATDSTFTITTQRTVLLCGSAVNRDKFQLEVGKEPTDYEPYCLVSVKMPVLTTSNEDGTKTNILTVNEDVTLRSNGNICDELNLLTGQLTQRIDEDGGVLSQEVVKTVDLTILDQNGQNVKQLMSFNGGTHFNTGSLEGSLPPSVSVCVETDLEETLKVCSLEGNTM